ncbi:MAG: alpha/beta hydrolase [Methylibium sp.]|nr:alpha/beta hydrolase [Methylibium sp.]
MRTRRFRDSAVTASASLRPDSTHRAARLSASRFETVRGLRQHMLTWGDPGLVTRQRPALVLAHGWMDVAASFHFLVDALQHERHVIALDWRGFGLSGTLPGSDTYWFPDYLGDLDALLDTVLPDQPVDLLGHSMGANVAMLYAGVRPERIRRLVNLEGFGLPDGPATLAPKRYAAWLDELRQPQRLRDYAGVDEVAERLRRNNPRLTAERAAWLAPHWSRRDEATGRWVIQGDPAHKRANPVLYRAEEALACWARITAPVLWVEGRQTDVAKYWGDRYPRNEFETRLKVVPKVERVILEDAGHMLHHDQPEQLAAHIERFLEAG